ncbi:MAG TPA: four helix bundle protein [Humisphaera sp.]|jgi:four helix bundle protein|nr:four helix bundle protein [Humisphaera sp.]
MGRSGFEKLEVYRLSEKLADATWKLVRRWDQFSQSTVGRQLIRAADSVGANVAEGFGRGTPADNMRFVRIARGSLYESKHWLRCAFRRELINSDEVDRIRPLLDELAPRLNAYLNSIGAPRKASTKESDL